MNLCVKIVYAVGVQTKYQSKNSQYFTDNISLITHKVLYQLYLYNKLQQFFRQACVLLYVIRVKLNNILCVDKSIRKHIIRSRIQPGPRSQQCSLCRCAGQCKIFKRNQYTTLVNATLFYLSIRNLICNGATLCNNVKIVFTAAYLGLVVLMYK